MGRIVVRFSWAVVLRHVTREDVAENRAEYRSMCFATPGLSEHIGGVILHWETLFQRDAQGKAIVDIIKDNGMIPGIKVDKGYNKKLGFAGDFSETSHSVKPRKDGESIGTTQCGNLFLKL